MENIKPSSILCPYVCLKIEYEIVNDSVGVFLYLTF